MCITSSSKFHRKWNYRQYLAKERANEQEDLIIEVSMMYKSFSKKKLGKNTENNMHGESL